MAKTVTAGEMRTRITVKTIARTVSNEGYETYTETSVFGGYVRCKWVNAHGSDVYENERLELGQTATITMRYSASVVPTCKIYRETDTAAWDVVSINDVEDRHKFLEIVVRREVVA